MSGATAPPTPSVHQFDDRLIDPLPCPSPLHAHTVEIFLLLVSLVVLGVAFLMFVRLFDALSPPTKALTWVVGGNFVLALFLLAFACFQQHFFLQRQYIPQGGAFCHYCNPVVLSLVVFNWLGQPVIAW